MPETLFDDVTHAVDKFWTVIFGENVQVIVAHPDPRIAKKQTFKYPCAALAVIGIAIDPDRRYGSILGTITADEEAGTATIEHPPIPIHIDYQLDTLAENRGHDLGLAADVLGVLGAYTQQKIVTNADREIYLKRIPGGLDAHDDLTPDDLWRKAFRFRVQTWLDDPREVIQATLVMQMMLNINEQQVEVTQD